MANVFRKKAAKLFINLADAAALVMALAYVIYVWLMLALGLGTYWLNIGMLVVTAVYVLFFFVKIFYINNIAASGKLSSRVKKITKWIRYGMRLINAAFVVLSIIAVNVGPEHLLPIIGAVATAVSFALSIAWEVIIYFVRRKITETISQWNAMEDKEKKGKIDFLIENLLQSLGSVNIQGLGEYVEYGARATEIVAEKLNSARASAQSKKLLGAGNKTAEPDRISHAEEITGTGEIVPDKSTKKPKEE